MGQCTKTKSFWVILVRMVWRSYNDWNDREVWLVWVLSMPSPEPTSKVEFNAAICDTTLAELPKIDEDEDGFVNGQIKKTKSCFPLFHPSFCSCSQTGSYVKEKKISYFSSYSMDGQLPNYTGAHNWWSVTIVWQESFYQHLWISVFMGLAAYFIYMYN